MGLEVGLLARAGRGFQSPNLYCIVLCTLAMLQEVYHVPLTVCLAPSCVSSALVSLTYSPPHTPNKVVGVMSAWVGAAQPGLSKHDAKAACKVWQPQRPAKPLHTGPDGTLKVPLYSHTLT